MYPNPLQLQVRRPGPIQREGGAHHIPDFIIINIGEKDSEGSADFLLEFFQCGRNKRVGQEVPERPHRPVQRDKKVHRDEPS